MPATEECAASTDARDGAKLPNFANATVVLVEDEPLLREITARILRQKGFEVLEAREAREVPNLIRENPGVSLLLTDVIMPGESGPALVKSLEASGLLKGVGVLFTSGYSSDELARYGFSGRGVHLLEKPFTSEELLLKIRDALGSASQHVPASEPSAPLSPAT